MDLYGLSSPDVFRIDDLLDFSNDDLFSSDSDHYRPPPMEISSVHRFSNDSSSSSSSSILTSGLSTDFTDELCVPSDDAAELEWLSQFVDDSFATIPADSFAGNLTSLPTTAFVGGRPRTKHSRSASSSAANRIHLVAATGKIDYGGGELSAGEAGGARRCTHCLSEKTPQWRTGPMGPKTLCNACGVRYKSGRLVPEYRPAASPTFVLTQHSNSHRKVMELRRQKELMVMRQQQQQMEDEQVSAHPQLHDYRVC